MTDPISVLLIIGAAVVGPIEARQTGWVDNPNSHRSYCDEWKTAPAGPLPHYGERGTKEPFYGAYHRDCAKVRGYESLPQLCERAMREVGAKTINGNEGWWGEILPVKVQEVTPASVRCIQVPRGYRR